MPASSDELLAATVQHELGNQLFRLLLSDGTTLIAGLSTEVRRLGLPISTGMRVEVRRARLDPARGTVLGPISVSEQTARPRTTVFDPTKNPRKRS